MYLPRRRYTAILIVLFAAATAMIPQSAESLQTVRIGVLAKRGLDRCEAKWHPTAVYLSNLVADHQFEIIPLDFAAIPQAVSRKTVDFILTNPSFHVELEDRYGVDAIATLINRMHCGDHTVFGGVIFSRAGDPDISGLDDLRGKDVMAVKETSLGGWRMAWRELQAAGITPTKDFKSLSFGGTHDSVVMAVLQGDVDAGTVRTDTMERMAAEGKFDMAALRILNINAAARDSLGIISSTRLYPEWPMAKLPHTSGKLAEQVAQALFRMTDDAPAAEAAKSAGWTYPLSYRPVNDCLKDLRLGPYAPHRQQSLSAVYQQHKAWFLSGGVAIIILMITAAWVAKLNARLSTSNTELMAEVIKRKDGEAQLAESETRLQTILDRSIAGVFIIDPETHTILDANQSALDMVGAKKDAVVGKKCHGFICPALEGRCPVTDLGQSFERAERTLIRADGTRCSILKTVTRFTLNGTELLLDSFIDISQLKETQYSLESALSASDEANRAKDQFLTNMSHELRTPMNGIIGMTNILQNTALDPDQSEFARTIMKSSEGLLGIINDILDYAHIEADDPKAECTDFDLFALTDKVVTALRPEAAEKKLVFTHTVDEAVPGFLRGDRRRLKRILHILLSNAIKFTPQGAVTLHVSAEPGNGKKCPITFKVSDTGIGIEEQRIDQIFTPFSQVDYSSTRMYGGIGLGLALAQHFTERMGGRMSVKSAPSKGSTFQVTLGLEELAAIPVRKPPKAAEIDLHRILVVDDHPTNRRVLHHYLSSWDLPCKSVESARKALAALHQAAADKNPFEVAIIDHMMPEMDGVDLGRAIKADPILAGVEMILLSSFDQESQTDDIRKVGFRAFLAKPVLSSRLFDCLTMICRSTEDDANTGPPAQSMITHATLAEAQTDGPRILVVEDNLVNQKVILQILRRNGCQADVANHGREAVETLSRNSYDVVLMDIQMPVMNGFEATGAIRNPENKCKDPGIPIIAVTANSMQDAKKECLEAGMDDFLPKPVVPDLLMEKIRHWCDKTHMEPGCGIRYSN